MSAARPGSLQLPFGLTEADLPIRGITSIRKPSDLHKGQSVILTAGDQSIFVKRTHGEAAKYNYLTDHGVPTPKLYTVITRDDHEIIVLECLHRIGVEPAEADDMLRLIAWINAVADPPHDIFALPPGRSGFDDELRVTLEQISANPQQWLDIYRRAQRTVATFPRTLNHGEMYFQQVGHTSAGELVVFDLETMALRPRFTDVASVLAPIAKMTGRSEQSLYPSHRRELLWTRLNQSFGALPWLFSERNATPNQLVRRLERDAAPLGLLT